MSQGPYTLLIDHIPGETRAALMQDDKLVELQIDRRGFSAQFEATEGNIYLGRVINVVPSLQAAFVDIGIGENGFLPVNATYEEDISKAVHVGQSILVQIRKIGQGDKGPLLSCKIDLAADHCVLTPGRTGINVSRKITDQTSREQIKSVLEVIVPKDCGLVTRTSAQTVPTEQLKTDVQKLVQTWHALQNNSATAPALLKDSTPFLERVWHEYRPLPLAAIKVDGIEAVQLLQSLGADVTPQGTLFHSESIEDQIEEAVQICVPLPDGGNIHIERTSALIAVDVNTGDRIDSRNTEDNRLRTNLDALNVLKDQIILRNLSGQIVIDFITLKSQSHKDKLRDAVKNKLSTISRLNIHGFTRLGLCEITRSRQGFCLDELYNAPETNLFHLIRHLSTGGIGKSLVLGANLYGLWTSPANKESVQWLHHKLGYETQVTEDKQLLPQDYRIEEL